ncbi:MAG: hypothetical protein KUL86_07595 [Castellaniella sp.]|nr:hypothetical protein [Castellaniella sp.]
MNTISALKCLTKECIGLQYAIRGAKEDDDPIVLIIRTVDALDGLQDQFGLSQAENVAKMDHIRSRIKSDGAGWIEVPWIYPSNDGSKIWFSNGRHRTWRMNELGKETIPVCTMRRFAQQLKPLWASLDIAKNEYDFSECGLPLLGN